MSPVAEPDRNDNQAEPVPPPAALRGTFDRGGDSTEKPAEQVPLDESDAIGTGEVRLPADDAESPTVLCGPPAAGEHSDAMGTGQSTPFSTNDDSDFEFVGGSTPEALRSGVFHREGGSVVEGSGINLEEFLFDDSILEEVRATPTLQSLKIDVPGKPERSFTITDTGIFTAFKDIAYVGHGSFGVVLKATDLLGRDVAIKVLTSDREEEAQRFYNEAKITAQLGASGPDTIIKVYERDALEIIDSTGQTRKAPYATMEFIDRTLSGTIRELEALRAEGEKYEYAALLKSTLCGHFIRACYGVEHAHHKGILHRDIKPDNIATSTLEEGESVGERTRVLDWGLGKRIEGSEAVDLETATTLDESSIKDLMTFYTANGAIVGSPPFMSPEQADPERTEDARSDVFALGATMYEILTGEFPHKGTDAVQIILNKIGGVHDLKPIEELNPLIPRPLRLIVQKAMAEDPVDRYQTASELAADIDRHYANTQVKAAELLPFRERVTEAAQLFLARHKKPLAVASILISSIVPVSVWGISERAENARAKDRAAAVSTVLSDVDGLSITDADFGIRQIDQMLQKTEGEQHETVLATIAALKEKREELVEFVDYRDAERARYTAFVKESNEILGSMTFSFRDPLGRFDSTHDRIEALLDQFGAKDDADWKSKLDAQIFSAAELAGIKQAVFELQVAAVLRVLPVADANLENRVALGDEANRARRAREAEPFLARAKAELAEGETSYALRWAEAAVQNLKEGKEYPALPAGDPVTEQDFFVAAWYESAVQGNYVNGLSRANAGLETYENSLVLFQLKAGILMSLGLTDLAVDTVAEVSQLAPSDPSVLLHKVIARGTRLYAKSFEDQEQFTLYAADYLSLCDVAVGQSRSNSPAFQYEANFRRMTARLQLAKELMMHYPIDDKNRRYISDLCDLAKTDLQNIGQIGIEFADLNHFAGRINAFAQLGRFGEVKEMTDMLGTLSEQFPASAGLARQFRWKSLNFAIGQAKTQKDEHYEGVFNTSLSDALEKSLQDFDQEQLLSHVNSEDFLQLERGGFAKEYARLVNLRAQALKIEMVMPILPNAEDPPFNRRELRSSKGDVVIERGPNGVIWREVILAEKGKAPELYYFTQVAVSDDTVTLHDRTRNLWVRVSETRGHFAEADGNWRLLYVPREND